MSTFVHPYLPNSVPEVRREMLDELGVSSVREILENVIPEDLLFRGRLDLPEPVRSEYELRRHVMSILNKNVTTEDCISFLGAGCYKHQVPAVCDELNQRGEFLTGYCGDTYSDHGKMQAIFEYTSMLGELLDADCVSYTTYDAGQSVCSSFRMAVRVQEARGAKRSVILVPDTMDPEILSQAESYTRSAAVLKTVPRRADGRMDREALSALLSAGDVAAVYYENPSYLGFLDDDPESIAALAHAQGALVIARTDIAALGVMESPLNLGADLVCGDIQPLGMHIQFGGGQAGYIACAEDLSLLKQFPTYMYSLCETDREGVYGWGRAMNYRSSHGSRENANEYFGTETGLWCITAGIYLASMGPQGMYDLGETVLRTTAYAAELLKEVPGVRADPFGGAKFQEFVVDFTGTGLTVREINKQLLKYGIFGGKDLSEDFPELKESALYCFSELTKKEDIQLLVKALKEITGGKR